MGIEALYLFGPPETEGVKKPPERVISVAVNFEVAAAALTAIAKLSGTSNQAEGAQKAAQSPELRKQMGIPEQEINEVVGGMQYKVLDKAGKDAKDRRPIDPRIMRHLAVLTRPAKLEQAGFAHADIQKMMQDTYDAIDGYIGTGTDHLERRRALRKINRLPKA